jgi:hypothetical protein
MLSRSAWRSGRLNPSALSELRCDGSLDSVSSDRVPRWPICEPPLGRSRGWGAIPMERSTRCADCVPDGVEAFVRSRRGRAYCGARAGTPGLRTAIACFPDPRCAVRVRLLANALARCSRPVGRGRDRLGTPMFVVPYLTVSVRQAGVARVEVGAADRNGRPGLIRSRRHREMEPARYEKPFERVPQLRLLAVELGGDPLLAQGRNALSDVGPAGPAVCRGRRATSGQSAHGFANALEAEWAVDKPDQRLR